MEYAELIAPCGMNCSTCLSYQSDKNSCSGCLGAEKSNSEGSADCIIKNCTRRLEQGYRFCYECETFPCARLRQLDKKYRSNYNTSIIDNLEYIRAHGLDQFVEKEQERWRCSVCGGQICIHRGYCLQCLAQ